MTPLRRLAAILSLDVEGFSGLVEADETAALAAVERAYKRFERPTVGEFGGDIFKTSGDGVLIEFGSAVNAVQWAARFQRALLARAMLRRPDLLVLDEPVQGVDFSGEVALYDLISDIRDSEGGGILLVSHDLHVVMAKTDTVVCLNGHVCCQGSPQSVASSPAYQRMFGPRAAETLAIYAHHHDHAHLPDGRVRFADGTIGDECTPVTGHRGAHDHHAGHDHHHHGPHASPAEAENAGTTSKEPVDAR